MPERDASLVDADGATVFVGWDGGAGAVDDVTDVLRSRGSGAAGSAVADVFGARLRPGVVEEKLSGVSKEWKVHLSWCDSFMRTSQPRWLNSATEFLTTRRANTHVCYYQYDRMVFGSLLCSRMNERG